MIKQEEINALFLTGGRRVYDIYVCMYACRPSLFLCTLHFFSLLLIHPSGSEKATMIIPPYAYNVLSVSDFFRQVSRLDIGFEMRVSMEF